MSKRPRLVLVEWEDAYSSNPGWLDIDEAKQWGRKSVLVRNAGYLVERSKERIVLAARWDKDRDRPYFGLMQRIPSGMVRRVWRLREPS